MDIIYILCLSGGSVESIGADGSVTVSYSNGTVKHISTDGRLVTMTYFNGDTKRTHQDGRFRFGVAHALRTPSWARWIHP